MDEDHAHCMSCVNQRCMVRPQPGISCDLITCPLVCGAVFHSCKAEEHHLLCPLLRVPCLNSAYGCPAALVRQQMYAHLEVCPAGVVCCTMEWNRWPVSCMDYSSYESLSRGVEEVEQLDMALALQDQRTLLESLKLSAVAPTVERGSLSPASKVAKVTEPTVPEAFVEFPSQSSSSHQTTAGSARERIANGINGLNEQHFTKLYAATLETAKSLATALELVGNASDPDSGTEGMRAEAALQTSRLGRLVQRGLSANGSQEEPDPSSSITNDCLEIVAAQDQIVPPVHIGKGVAQRAGHVVLQERGLVRQNHKPEWMLHSCHSFRAQDKSLCRSQTKMEDKTVDTSDLEQGDDPMGIGEIDLITAALIFCLEESRECRRISDTIRVEGGRINFGTQTFSFPAAVLVTNTRVGDMASASACDHAAPQLSYPSPFRTLRLGLVLEAQEVEAVPHNYYLQSNGRYQHMFPFVCAQPFRRDQFSSHFTNVHGDIHAGLNGWMEHRCPLAFYGCTFSQRRFYPSRPEAKVVHDRHLRSFGVQPCPGLKPSGDSQSDQFSGLPNEILWHIAGFLDSFSLCQLSLVSRTMRDVCASLLQTRGIVELQWERRQCSSGRRTVSWQIQHKVWRFSTAFSPVLKWGFTNLPSMSDHLKKCQYNTAEHRTEPVPLPAMCPEQEGYSLRRTLRHVST
ncbi:F-box only protein 30b [Dunckerocampus dactyliophorus]|uniref:F-box only protein 30b n=1 Tax=Dunckerocampus dactyliophorus TaxID=161453 RepID=UPI0024066E45|nr:F-box only protein 30b [Dunckerocampus dactyliophorus]XP_054617010.1 F-box only protein 30b [Dunckerocampus dactyliophorus]XP_054617011.1 F-box only protein 30b [Dunckerocampus dactyliophorus]